MTRVCHLSSVHRGLDTRIFHKECVSLAAAKFDVHLVITASAAEVAAAASKGVKVHPLGLPAGRLSRVVKQAWRCYRLGKRLDADIYHFHDPELIPYGVLLALAGKEVIYDVHEDSPRDILSKNWIAPWLRKIISRCMAGVEYVGARWFFSVVAATPFIAQRFLKITPHTININNYPIINELAGPEIDWSKKKLQICYVGGIGRIRGILELVRAMGQVTSDARLKLVGTFSEPDVEASAHADPGWERVDALGWQDRQEVRAVLCNSVAGLVTFLPDLNHINAQPNKMFEYMSASVPVIASRFQLWEDIIQGSNCGLCVDPLDSAAIAGAIDYLVTHPQEAEQMGRNGQIAVREQYNWGVEEKKLLALYASL